MVDWPPPLKTVDLEFDGGEGYDDAALMPYASTVHIACGGHTGDDASMREAVLLAKEKGVAIGAHPSYPDRASFGRKKVDVPPEALAEEIGRQIESLLAIVAGFGSELVSVKPHGALYHEVARDADLARLFARTVSAVTPRVTLVTFPKSELHVAASQWGLRSKGEAFADRRYEADGSLVSRTEPDALIEDPEEAARQALSIVRDRVVTARGGTPLEVYAQALCVHSDTPGAGKIAAAVRGALVEAGYEVKSQ
ncbi:MAG TPA: 5-oxoprolinase subunit PxpA [Thermoanaerobaculia bacterium]|nr:5-oxoprolinase subunit PxpA [Thermoanaerobaculia bacterium]